MLKLALSIVVLLTSLPAIADHQLLICAECRDVRDHPRDYGNYAFNKLIEPLDNNFSIFTTYASSTYVHSLDNQWALVLLEDEIRDTGVSVTWGGFNIPIQISSKLLRITVQDQYGGTTIYRVVETSNPLVVGDGTPPPPPTNPAPPPAPEPSELPSLGGIGTPCCQSGEFYWYWDMPEFRIDTFPE